MSEQVHNVTDLPKEPSKVQMIATRVALAAAAVGAVAYVIVKTKSATVAEDETSTEDTTPTE